VSRRAVFHPKRLTIVNPSTPGRFAAIRTRQALSVRRTRKASVPSLRAMAWYPAWVRALPRARWTSGRHRLLGSDGHRLTWFVTDGTRAFGTVADSRPQKPGRLQDGLIIGGLPDWWHSPQRNYAE